MLAEASAIERSLSWTIGWPREAPDRTVFQGTLDFLACDRNGDWRIVVIALAEALAAGERLRLLIGSRAAAALGYGPIRQGWLLRLGPDGGLDLEEQFEPADLDALFGE
jgi:hypothetical protein